MWLCTCVVVAGADLYGPLPKSDIGPSKECEPVSCIEELRGLAGESNDRLAARLLHGLPRLVLSWWQGFCKKLVADTHEDELHRLTMQDAQLGRMTWPRPAKDIDLSSLRLAPR